MTIADKINILNSAIVKMNTNLSYGSSYSDELFSYGGRVKSDAVQALKNIGAPQYSINSIQNVSFNSCQRDMFGCHVGEYEMKCANKCNAYKQSVNSVINILEQERTHLIQEQNNKEQKSNKRLAKWTLVFSIIAALGTIASVLLAIFN